MIKHHSAVFLIASLLLCAAPAGHAQQREGKDFLSKQAPAPVTEDPWKFALTPYFWLPSIDIEISTPVVEVLGRSFGGTVSQDVSIWDLLGDVFQGDVVIAEVGGRFEVSKGRWGAFADGYWVYLRAKASSNRSKLVLDDDVQVDGSATLTSTTEFGQFNFGPKYLIATVPLSKAANGPSVAIEAYGGGRVNWVTENLKGSVTFDVTAPPGIAGTTRDFNTTKSRAYIEPMIGLRTTWTLGEKMVAVVRGDVAGFGWAAHNNWDCDLEAGLGWEFHRNTYMNLSYRARGQWQDDGSGGDVKVSGWLYGPELGMTFKF